MFMYEVLARDRMREDHQRASQARLARQVAAARRWQRLARYAERRARHATERLGELASSGCRLLSEGPEQQQSASRPR